MLVTKSVVVITKMSLKNLHYPSPTLIIPIARKNAHFEIFLDPMKIGIEFIESEIIQIAIFTTHAFFALSARVRLNKVFKLMPPSLKFEPIRAQYLNHLNENHALVDGLLLSIVPQQSFPVQKSN